MKQTKMTLMVGVFLLSGMFLLNSCNSGSSTNETTNDSTATTETTADTSTASKNFSDAQIASIVLAANQIDIDNAKIAKDKSKNSQVLQFAETMIKDHSSVNDQAKALASKLNLTPEDNPTTQSLQSGAAATQDSLKSKSGADFDKAYVDNEVAYHKAAIDLVENKLIPDAQNADLKSLLQTALPVFKEHLAHAEKLQGELNK